MSTVFYFNVNYYKQLDSVAMGSPLGPALANAFLCHLKANGLENVQLHMLQFCINIMLMMLKSGNHINNLLFYLNSKYPNIIFTCETEKSRSLAF